MLRPFSQRSGIETDRRAVLAGCMALLVLPSAARSETDDLEKAVHAFTGGSVPKSGKVAIDVAPLVENGNAVAVEITVDHPMNKDNFVKEIALFNERNPQPEVAVFHLSPRSGQARVITRIRLATSQHVVAVARLSDGNCWADRREVIVTIAACTEE